MTDTPKITEAAEWAVFEYETGVTWSLDAPATEANAREEARLVGVGHVAMPKWVSMEMSNAWAHGRHARIREERRAQTEPPAVTDAMVERAWRTYEEVDPDTFVIGPWIGKARKRMRTALEAALAVSPKKG